jgi:hypothetical protein
MRSSGFVGVGRVVKQTVDRGMGGGSGDGLHI